MSAFCQYFPVLPLFSVKKDIISPAAFYRHHFVGSNLSPVFLLPFCQHFFAIFCGHLPAAYCQHHVTSSIFTAELYKHYKHFDSILQVSFCQTFSSSILPTAFCQNLSSIILAGVVF